MKIARQPEHNDGNVICQKAGGGLRLRWFFTNCPRSNLKSIFPSNNVKFVPGQKLLKCYTFEPRESDSVLTVLTKLKMVLRFKPKQKAVRNW